MDTETQEMKGGAMARTYHKKVCLNCDAEFETLDTRQKFCSRSCGSQYTNAPKKKYYVCQHCGKSFWKDSAYRMKYCSVECSRQAFRDAHPSKQPKEKQIFTKECAWCGAVFETTSPQKIYCSYDCCYDSNLKMKREQWAEEYIPRRVVCKECGTDFFTECGDTHSVFCCKSCADRYERNIERKTNRFKEYMRKVQHRRAKQLRENFVEDVSYDALYKRDKGICRVCGLPVHSDKFCDNNWGGTIDHIIPLSVGGEHSMSNCQLAHRICNSIKMQNASDFSLDWEIKSQQNNYWKIKYEAYKKLMGTAV